MAGTDHVTEAQVFALVDAIAARGSSVLYTGTDAYAVELLAVVRTGDYFMYNDGGAHPGWLYRWDGAAWVYAANLKGADGSGGAGGGGGIDGGTWDSVYGGTAAIDGGGF